MIEYKEIIMLCIVTLAGFLGWLMQTKFKQIETINDRVTTIETKLQVMGDILRAVLIDPAYKFDGAPTYRPKGSTGNKLPFETKIGDQEYWSKFPKGYDGGAYFPTTKV